MRCDCVIYSVFKPHIICRKTLTKEEVTITPMRQFDINQNVNVIVVT